MGNNVDNGFLNKLNETLFKDGWLQNLYGTERANQQSELKKLFTTVSDNNVTKAEKAQLEAKAATLADQVEMLEAKMAVLAEEMSKKEDMIAKRADYIADLVKGVEKRSKEMQEEQEIWSKECVRDVFKMYENQQIGKDGIVAEIRVRMQNCPAVKKLGADIEVLLGDLDSQKSKVQGLVDEAAKWMDQKKILEAQYGCTKSAYDMLQANIAQIGATGTNYTNMDTNTNVPIYSPEKTATVASLMSNTTYNVQGGNTAKAEGAEAPTPITIEQIKEKHADNLGVKATGADHNSISNDAVKALGKALDDGLFEDLVSTGMSFNDIKDFFAENFKGANIKVNDEGKMSIPYGHGADAQKIFAKLNTKVENYNPYQGALNTWDDYGNTIETNPQIGALKQFVADGNFAQLKEQGFTFKEAMYALFDPEKGLFKDTGIVYELDEQTGEPKYFMQYAGDKDTADLFKEVAAQIYDNWGVGFYRGPSAADRHDPEEVTQPTEVPTDPTPSETKRTDPLSFHIGNDKNNKYSFVMDRDGDGKFSGAEEFVGGKEGTSWLDDLKTFDTDGNGILEGDELKNVKLFGTNYTDNADKYEDEEGNLRGERTDVDYQITSAADLGITSIDLRNLEGNVDQTTGQTDINDNEIYNDSFTMTMNGQEVEVHRLDETEDFMNAIYGAAYGKNFEIGLSEVDADAIMAKDYGEFDNFDARFANLFQNIGILKSVGDIAQETRILYEDAMQVLREQNNIELTKAANRAAAMENNANWNNVRAQVISIANEKGLSLSEADLTQMKGIYILDAGLDAQGVVDTFQEQAMKQQQVDAAKEAGSLTWSAIIECAKNGITPDAKAIMEKIMNGDAKTLDEIIAQLKEAMPQEEIDVELVTQEIGFDSEREKAIFEAFNSVFAAAGLADMVVPALADLCADEINDPETMDNQTPNDLAKRYLRKYQQQ